MYTYELLKRSIREFKHVAWGLKVELSTSILFVHDLSRRAGYVENLCDAKINIDFRNHRVKDSDNRREKGEEMSQSCVTYIIIPIDHALHSSAQRMS